MNTSDVEIEHMGTLQNLEFIIINFDRSSDDLTDLEVIDVLDYLIRAYTAKGNGHSAPFVRLSPLKRELSDAISVIADMITAPIVTEPDSAVAELDSAITESESSEVAVQPSGSLTADNVILGQVTPEVLIACLKRIRKSAKYWNGNNGRRGYLEYIANFM